MDPRNRADEALARASSRGAFVVTPDNATSPMDASSTVRIPREIIDGADDPDSTVIIPQPPPEQPPSEQPSSQWSSPQSSTRRADESDVGWPPDDRQQYGRAQHDHTQHGRALYDPPDYGQPQYGSPRYGNLRYDDPEHPQSRHMRVPPGHEEPPPNPYDAQRGPNEFGPLGPQAHRRPDRSH